VINENRADNMRDLLYYCYLYFTVVMVLLCMNLLPRERDENTLEILWSQPMRRGILIFMQLMTVAAWVFLMSLFVVFFFGYFSSYSDGRLSIVIYLFTTSFTVGAITILVSTYCLHGIATGLVTLLILGVHFYWLRPIGPIELFYNPIPYPGADVRPDGLFGLIFNRTITLVLAGFVLDYLFRRLRQTARWFT
jgi:ABC-type transport system involved in multi-copper enzyme maturation permease subunit